jgi:hypothetical protein
MCLHMGNRIITLKQRNKRITIKTCMYQEVQIYLMIQIMAHIDNNETFTYYAVQSDLVTRIMS